MSRILLVLGLSACVAGDPGTRRVDQRIIGGQVVQPADFPSVVALENEPGAWFCTGTLIAKDWILTAAHCVEGETAAGIQIRFDDDDINDTVGGKVVDVAAIHAHPDYDGEAWDNDVALVRLAAAVTDREATPLHRPVLAAPAQVTEVGYGDADDDGGGAGVLRKLRTTSIDCARTRDSEISGAKVLCFDASDGTSSCYGDSGGPAFVEVDGKLAVAGITSGGTEDSCMEGYDIYTSVAGELAFIDEALASPPPADEDPEEDPEQDPGETPAADTATEDDGGCSTGGSSSALGLGLVLLALRRRPR